MCTRPTTLTERQAYGEFSAVISSAHGPCIKTSQSLTQLQ